MLILINNERKNVGSTDLKMNDDLSKVAEAHAREMLANGYLSHINLKKENSFDRLKAAGISFFFAGENIAFSDSVENAMNDLMASSGHRSNIVSNDYGKVGVAVLDAGDHGKIFVQEFTD